MSETTAGPWVVNGCGGDFKLVARMHAGVMVAAAAPLGDPLLDARLIAAAPDLLRAAQELIGTLGAGGYFPTAGEPKTRALRAAIAKAEGR